MDQASLQVFIGCSGFSYKEWKELFYPKGLSPTKWFEYYCAQFDTLELNVTFYRTPLLSTLEGWHKRSPAHFLFSVKAPKVITHYMQFRGTASLQRDFYTLVRSGLAQKLGPVLYQLPASLTFSKEVLARMLENMDPGFTNVIEFRHESWWREETYRALAAQGTICCSCSFPGLPDRVIPGSPTVYYRFHGVPDLYRSLYDPAFLKAVLEQVCQDRQTGKAFLYFNNTASGAAIKNADEMKLLVMNRQPTGAPLG
jgi:uncharacterized protein YecE (DUF72 family)